MVSVHQGNIFDFAGPGNLLVVFGHFGFNTMKDHAKNFFMDHGIEINENPFDGRIININASCDVHFVFCDGGGMTHEAVVGKIMESVNSNRDWKLECLVTNGAPPVGRGHDTNTNRDLNLDAARRLMDFFRGEFDHDVEVKLVSMNSVFLDCCACE
jgi:hypothetical protein